MHQLHQSVGAVAVARERRGGDRVDEDRRCVTATTITNCIRRRPTADPVFEHAKNRSSAIEQA